MYTEKIVVNKGGKYPLNGILTLPENKNGNYPAVVFVHGSGSSNMDEKVMKMTPFKDIAEGLAKKGIASIRYDKRSFAHGFKMIREKNITVYEETIEDAIAATSLLRKDKRIDSNQVYIIGHSMGAMLAPRIDYEGGNYAGLILMAGTPNTLVEVLFRQLEEMLHIQKGLAKFALQKQYDKYKNIFSRMYEMNIEESKKIKMDGGTTLYYFKEMAEKPAKQYLDNCTKPILILQGSHDFQVSIEADYNAYIELLKNKKDVTFKLYEGLNHTFTKALYSDITKAKKEYDRDVRVEDVVIEDIANWIRKN